MNCLSVPRVGRWLRAALFALAAVLSGACAVMRPMRPLASEAEALAVHGQPVARRINGDGTATLEYSTQPFGHTALMVTVDAAGMVVRQEDALAPENLARVQPGMTRDEVSRLLGRHRSVQNFALSGEEVWDWNVYNDGPGIATLFNVHFVAGKVARTSRSYIFPHDDRSMNGPGQVAPSPGAGGFAFSPR